MSATGFLASGATFNFLCKRARQVTNASVLRLVVAERLAVPGTLPTCVLAQTCPMLRLCAAHAPSSYVALSAGMTGTALSEAFALFTTCFLLEQRVIFPSASTWIVSSHTHLVYSAQVCVRVRACAGMTHPFVLSTADVKDVPYVHSVCQCFYLVLYSTERRPFRSP